MLRILTCRHDTCNPRVALQSSLGIMTFRSLGCPFRRPSEYYRRIASRYGCTLNAHPEDLYAKRGALHDCRRCRRTRRLLGSLTEPGVTDADRSKETRITAAPSQATLS